MVFRYGANVVTGSSDIFGEIFGETFFTGPLGIGKLGNAHPRRCDGCRLSERSERSESTLPVCQFRVSQIIPHALNCVHDGHPLVAM